MSKKVRKGEAKRAKDIIFLYADPKFGKTDFLTKFQAHADDSSFR